MKVRIRRHKAGGAGVTPPGTRKQDLSRRFDQTQLRANYHGTLVHRDYAAHYFRWGFMTKFLPPQGSKSLLDVGCGQDLPLIRVICGNINALPSKYVGVDLNRLPECGVRWVEALYDEVSFVDNAEAIVDNHGHFDLVACFEVIEHMHSTDGIRLLSGMRDCLAEDGMILLSTPVYNGKKMAANHLHEWTIEELSSAIGAVRLRVMDRWGTFGSWPDMCKVISPEERALLEELNCFYPHDVLACFLAPKYPDASRNNVWALTHA